MFAKIKLSYGFDYNVHIPLRREKEVLTVFIALKRKKQFSTLHLGNSFDIYSTLEMVREL